MPGRERSQIFRANALFKRVLAPARLQREARRVGFIQRQRIADASSVFWALVVTLGSHTTQYISDVLRTLNYQQDWTLRYKPFWNRLSKPAFARFMRETFQRLCSELATRVVRLEAKSAGAFFSDILIDDGSSFGLADGLRHIFPGRFTKVRPAAVELHAHMSLLRDQVVSVKLAPDTKGEREFLPRPEQLPRRSLSLRDRGYLDIDYFAALEKTEAYVICRSRRSINPVVLEVRGVARSLARRWRGKRLAALPLSRLKAGVELIVGFPRPGSVVKLRLIVRKLAPRRPQRPKRLRKNPAPARDGWLYLLTNLFDTRFKMEDIERLYRLRWQLELVFKDWKSYANLHILQSENPAIVEGLIWAALCAAFLKRSLAHWTQLVHRRPVSTRISAQAGPHILHMMARWAMQRTPLPKLARILAYLATNAARAHPNRDLLRPQAALGLAFAYS
jgi:hypothetical protein